jgi:hypothetical protein
MRSLHKPLQKIAGARRNSFRSSLHILLAHGPGARRFLQCTNTTHVQTANCRRPQRPALVKAAKIVFAGALQTLHD